MEILTDSFNLELPMSNATNSTAKSLTNFYIGLGLAIGSSLFIGSSFILKKKALLRLATGGVRAGDGGIGYLKDYVWWSGMILMFLGEMANFAAYGFAPASLVTSLGALSVLVTALMSSYWLGEILNLAGKLGCFLCVVGSSVVVLHSPKEQEISSMADLKEMLQEPLFLIYAIMVFLVAIVLIFWVGPNHGHTNPLVYVSLTASVGSLTVMACKGLGVAIKQTAGGQNQFTNWLTYVIGITMIICISVQMNYLNRALDVFDASIITPILYVFFTIFVIVASSILFKEFNGLAATDIFGIICGFSTIIVAIFLLNGFKDLDLSVKKLNLRILKSDSVLTNNPRSEYSALNQSEENSEIASLLNNNNNRQFQRDFENLESSRIRPIANHRNSESDLFTPVAFSTPERSV